MKLATSMIGWPKDVDVLSAMKESSYAGVEIAPSMAFEKCYDASLEEIKSFKKKIGLPICSMQSLLYGYTESIFENDITVENAILKMKTVIEFAEKIECKNLVFGSPKNRLVNNEEERSRAVYFFNEIADYASNHSCYIAVEANPTIYNTNFINYTKEALDFVKELNNPGMKVNLDLGTVICNEENLEEIINSENIDYISHVHISEPNLVEIDESRLTLHKKLFNLLNEYNYDRYVSIEMRQNNSIVDKVKYVERVANGNI